jgi:hypothetical protein
VGSVGVLQAPKLLLARLAGAAFASSGGGGVPVGEAVENDSRYDAIVDNGRKRLLVQVNYGQECRPGVYAVKAWLQEHSGNRRAPKTVKYFEAEIDFLAVYWRRRSCGTPCRMRRCAEVVI